MWMMGYNEPLEDHMNINTLEPYTTNNNNNATRKLRPLVPRPPPPICSSYNNHNRFHHDHNLHSPGEQNKREFSSQQMVVVSSRWNPTPEQLQTLEELYRRGTRTPSAEEIQHITAQLRRFGKIEGKNVFYWFQNHKARERQKRRRQLDKELHFNSVHLDQSIQRKDSPEVEETRNWAIPTFSDQKVNNMGREKSRKAAAADEGWMIEPQQQEQEPEGSGTDQLQRRRKSIPATTATWNNNMMHCINLSSSPSSAHPTNHINNASLIGSTSCCNPTTTFATKMSSSVVVTSRRHDNSCDVESYETLELFPVNSSSGPSSEVEKLCLIDEMNSSREVNFCPTPHFIEFLPLKN